MSTAGAGLASAAEAGDQAAVKAHLGSGVSPDATAADGSPAACFAAWKGHLDVLEALQQAGAKLGATEPEFGWTPLIFAAANGRADCVAALLRWGADVDSLSQDKQSALHAAAFYGQLDCARLLVEAGADRSLRDGGGKTPHDRAESEGHAEIAALLASAEQKAKKERANVERLLAEGDEDKGDDWASVAEGSPQPEPEPA